MDKFINGLMKLVTGVVIALVGYVGLVLLYNLLVKPVLLIYMQAGIIQALITFSLEVVFVGFIVILIYIFKKK